jgi:hypothetical protein
LSGDSWRQRYGSAGRETSSAVRAAPALLDSAPGWDPFALTTSRSAARPALPAAHGWALARTEVRAASVAFGGSGVDPGAPPALRNAALADARLAKHLKLSKSSLQRVAALSEAIAINAVYDLGRGGKQVRCLPHPPWPMWVHLVRLFLL